MRIDAKILAVPFVAFSCAVACGSDTVLTAKGHGSDAGDASTGGNSSGNGGSGTSSGGGSNGGRSGSTGNAGTAGASGRSGASGSGASGASGSSGASGATGNGGTAGSTGNGGRAGAAGGGGTAAGGRGAGGGPLDGGTLCNRLAACCATVIAPLKPSCDNLVSQNQPAACQAAMGLGIYCGAIDGGAATRHDAGPAACTDLMACCSGLGPQRTSCEQLAGLGDLASCAAFANLVCP